MKRIQTRRRGKSRYWNALWLSGIPRQRVVPNRTLNTAKHYENISVWTESSEKETEMRILTLDLATKTGWATNYPEASGVDTFDVRRGESPGTRYLRFTGWLREKIDLIRPELVVYEKAHHRGGAATEVAVGFATHLQSVCAAAGIEHAAIHTSTIKKYATGKGNAGKAEMMAAYQKRWGRAPIDDNECDARWLLEYAINRY